MTARQREIAQMNAQFKHAAWPAFVVLGTICALLGLVAPTSTNGHASEQESVDE